MKPTLKKKSDLAMRHNRLRARILRLLHCRTTLILVSLFVVLECICVMAELMVDLQGLRLRFDNEEIEIEKFVQYMKSKNSNIFENFQGRSLEDLLNTLKTTTSLWKEPPGASHKPALCNCSCSDGMPQCQNAASRRKRSKSTLLMNLSNKDKLRTNLLTSQIKPDGQLLFTDRIYPDNSKSNYLTYQRYRRNDAKFKVMHRLKQMINRKRRLKRTAGDMLLSQVTPPKQHEAKYSNTLVTYESIINDIKFNQTKTLSFEAETSTDTLRYNIPRLKTNAEHKDASAQKVKFDQIHASLAEEERSNDSSEYQVTRLKRDAEDILSKNAQTDNNVFVFSLFAEDKQYHIVAEVVNVANYTDDNDMLKKRESTYSQYELIHDVSHSIKFIGFGILSIMLIETLVKVACLGLHFFKRKIEVFDACIVLISFVLDVVFLDSKWYETGKDATTILVLLLPWRVVRIVNSFIISINHKHHIEMMTVRRAKKKCDLKMKKLQQLMHEMRRDVDLLIRLCKNRGATEAEITTCIYGKGRGTTTVAAMTGFASLMFISTLGKDPSIAEVEDDVYGEFIRDILEEEEEQYGSDKAASDPSKDEDPEDAFILEDDVYSVSKTISRRSGSGRSSNNRDKWPERRRATLPRRHQSCNDDESNGYYINDGYVTNDEKTRDGNVTSSSLPIIHTDAKTKNFVTFEVTSQMVTQSYNTYL